MQGYAEAGVRVGCTPELRVTRSLLGYGMLAGPLYLVASLIEGIVRPGFDFTRHDWSLLANGEGGWVHRLVLGVTGLMVMAAGAGFARYLRGRGASVVAGWLLAVYGAGLVGAGVFSADPANGFPVGAPEGANPVPSASGLLHLAFAGVGFLALVICCLLCARRLRREGAAGWAAFSIVTGVLFLAAFAGIASGGGSSSAMVLAFTAAIVLAWAWLLLMSLRIYRQVSSAGIASAVHG